MADAIPIISSDQIPLDKVMFSREEAIDIDTNDNASVLVIILFGETRECNGNITHLKWVFSDPYFTVQICRIEPPKTNPSIKGLDYNEYINNYFMRKALTYAMEGPYNPDSNGNLVPQHWWKDIPVIIVKDSSISNVVPSSTTNFNNTSNIDNKVGGMKQRIKIALEKAVEADLFFLCKWNDACDKYTDVKGVTNIDHGSMLKWSLQPTSTQAIMYRPKSRDQVRKLLADATTNLGNILNSNINKGKLLATVFVPNIIDFDIELATSNNDYNKLSQCAPVTSSQEINNIQMTTIIWLGIIAIIIVLVAWLVIRYLPR